MASARGPAVSSCLALEPCGQGRVLPRLVIRFSAELGARGGGLASAAPSPPPCAGAPPPSLERLPDAVTPAAGTDGFPGAGTAGGLSPSPLTGVLELRAGTQALAVFLTTLICPTWNSASCLRCVLSLEWRCCLFLQTPVLAPQADRGSFSVSTGSSTPPAPSPGHAVLWL